MAPPAWIAGAQWAQHRLRQPGWLVLPLRGFLGVTFTYAGLQKLANPAYLDAHNPASVVGQMQSLRHASPLGPLLGLSLHAPTLVGLLIAFGEVAAGTGALLGLRTRLAAVGGMLLSLTFFLTVSWSTTPYYYGSDIVFIFAWSVLAGLGAGDVLSLDGWLSNRARRLNGLPSTAPLFSIEASRLRSMCTFEDSCGLRLDGCSRVVDCPAFGTGKPRRLDAADVEQRRRLLTLQAAGVVAVGTLGVGGATALLGRLVGGTDKGGSSRDALLGRSRPAKRSARRGAPSPRNSRAPGTAIASISALAVGQAGQFTDPKTGGPAWLVHPTASTFVAFSATCTHAGCTVGFDGQSMEFVCPCHGGTYDAKTGRVLNGPPPSPLPSIPVHVVNGTVRVD